MVVSKKDDTMESMSNTRKEIANRLGVSVRSGAKTTMGMKLVKTFPTSSQNRSAKIYRDSDYNAYLVKLYDNGKYNANADYETDDLQDAIGTAEHYINLVYASRPGTKAKMAAASGAPDISAFAERIKKYAARNSKDEMVDAKVIKEDVRALNAVLMYVKAGDRNRAVKWVDSLDTVISDVIPRSIYNWIYKGYSARSGAKAKFGLRPVKVFKSKPVVMREARIFQNTEDNSYVVKYFENDNVVKEYEADSLADATDSAQAFIKSGTRPAFSRPGAKAKFAEATGSKKYFLGELDTIIAGISEMNRLLEKQARGNPKIKEVSTALNKAESVMVAAESKLMQIDFSRPGVKTKFEYSQSDYMALRRYYQMAMTGNPDVFEDNTAMRLANKAIASPNYRPNPSAAWSHDLAKELLDGFEGMHNSRPGMKAKFGMKLEGSFKSPSGAREARVFSDKDMYVVRYFSNGQALKNDEKFAYEDDAFTSARDFIEPDTKWRI